jgi:hypothetical protein
MQKIYRSLTITISTALFLATTPFSAVAEQTVYCSSESFRYNFCRANTHGGVRLQQQLSNSRCKYTRDWGYENEGIWVDNGCKANFVVGSQHEHKHQKNDDVSTGAIIDGAIAIAPISALLGTHSDFDKEKKNESQEITCSSDGEYNRCKVNSRNGVLFRRQISENSCWQGQTWGYDNNAIWVDKGCRAVFLVN